MQRLGKFSIPCGGWTLLRLDPPNAVILHVGAEQLRIVAAGKWTPEEPDPCIPSPPEPPQPQPHESHQSYAQRFLQWSCHTMTNPEWLKWRARKV